jgi:hypothetical protein
VSNAGSFDVNAIIKHPFTREPSQPLIKIVIIYITTHTPDIYLFGGLRVSVIYCS